ncbi:glutamyl-tRNA synthetase [Candidatus Photodesmus katoptron]|uniref:Glutamate--tRNA ligase n=1 Tax=Candidatus Photodesmus katoptron Akat1 TaxID=1236703 RepID=S3DL47_9GAMM|nr:glutamate--tRNA ligase [Candidatus Photodesmus katoptron]EPE37859.1 glutamyl-tRNA synthetase [Candidatus Photodesmus katoptron Akat1]KEY90422.1 glutamyl-tRNA synthetase [Candidatus Photodesmus katoptron]
MKVRTRFAPSPTGFLHIGGIRTALYSWLFSKKYAGDFILRIEDTDLERSTKEAIDAILEGMTWMGLTWNEGPYYQTNRLKRYNQIIDKLIFENKAFKCYASKELLEEIRTEQILNKEIPRYDANHPKIKLLNQTPNDNTPHVVRFRNPKTGSVVFNDKIRGRIEIHNQQLDDLIIRRSDGIPTYNFCVVVDDWDMGITHVIRGEEHINNTPRQINIYQALGAKIPIYAHCSMILGDNGAKLSKRQDAESIMHYRNKGYLPNTLNNYLIRLGWSHGNQEIFSIEELIHLFSFKAISKSSAIFDPKKLLWLNNHYIKTSTPEYIVQHLQWHLDQQGINKDNGPNIIEVCKLVRNRCNTLVELADQIHYFYKKYPNFEMKIAQQYLSPIAKKPLQLALIKAENLAIWTTDNLKKMITEICSELKIKTHKIGMPLRVAITGRSESPSINAIMQLIGQNRVILRIKKALEFINNKS